MSTIGDRFADLAALFGGEGEAPSEDQPGAAPTPEGEEAGTSTNGGVLITALEDLGIKVDEGDFEADLQADLDLQGLALWALVAELERQVGRSVADSTARSWTTLNDVLTWMDTPPTAA